MKPTPVLRAALAVLFALAGLGARAADLPGAPPGPVVTTAQVRAELMAQAPDGVAAGKPLWLGLQLQHRPGW
ncbi:MAG: hypothetical protein KGK09_06080, partial [Burkholderiales bacterium]|nr:hypothetical protein [Burkholderiales bacterium]